MNNSIIEMTIKKNDIPHYCMEFAKDGRCRCLAPVSYYESCGAYVCSFDVSGLVSLSESIPRERTVLSEYMLFLKRLKSITEAMAEADDCMIGSANICLDFDRIFFDVSQQRAEPRFLLEGCGGDFYAKTEKLLCDANKIRPALNAGLILDRLETESSKGLLNRRKIVKILSLCELEIN